MNSWDFIALLCSFVEIFLKYSGFWLEFLFCKVKCIKWIIWKGAENFLCLKEVMMFGQILESLFTSCHTFSPFFICYFFLFLLCFCLFSLFVFVCFFFPPLDFFSLLLFFPSLFFFLSPCFFVYSHSSLPRRFPVVGILLHIIWHIGKKCFSCSE